MQKYTSIQVYVSAELAEQVRAAAAANGLAVSEWLRSLAKRACESELALASDRALLARLYRQSLFGFVGLDALLAGHPDHALRERVHSIWKARCQASGMGAAPDEGGSDEA
jgi:hypothetical protein